MRCISIAHRGMLKSQHHQYTGQWISMQAIFILSSLGSIHGIWLTAVSNKAMLLETSCQTLDRLKTGQTTAHDISFRSVLCDWDWHWCVTWLTSISATVGVYASWGGITMQKHSNVQRKPIQIQFAQFNRNSKETDPHILGERKITRGGLLRMCYKCVLLYSIPSPIPHVSFVHI